MTYTILILRLNEFNRVSSRVVLTSHSRRGVLIRANNWLKKNGLCDCEIKKDGTASRERWWLQ